ncbi:response regulator [Sulfitobacter sp. LCG007]
MILDGSGFEVVGPAGNVETAVSLISDGKIDAAILDLYLAHERSDEIANCLAEKSVPFLYLTGHGREHLPAAHSGRALLRKPFREDKLVQEVISLLASEQFSPSDAPAAKTRSDPALYPARASGPDSPAPERQERSARA